MDTDLILITGGTGFVGTYLIRRLTAENKRVRSFDYRPPAAPAAGVEYIGGDIRDAEAVAGAARGCGLIFHLAGLPSIARGSEDTYHRVNIGGAENVMAAARAAGARRVVYLSSSTVYGLPRLCPLPEDAPLGGIGPYGRSKVAAEAVCRDNAGAGLSVSIIRPRVIMGAGRLGLFTVLFDAVLENRPVYMVGRGDNVFQFTAVTDVVQALLLAAAHPESGTFNVGADDYTPVKDVLAGLIRHAGSSSRLTAALAPLVRMALRAAARMGLSPLVDEQFMIADKNFVLDTARAKTILGWQATQTNIECLIEAFDWYRENRDSAKRQFSRRFWIFGRYRHSRQGGFQS